MSSASAAAAAKSLQLCLSLCDPIDGSLLGSSVPGILQARILEWVAIAFSVLWMRNIQLYKHVVTMLCLFAQSCLTLCDPMDYSLPGSSVHGDSPARILEKVAMPSHRGSSEPRGRTQVSHIAGGLFTI